MKRNRTLLSFCSAVLAATLTAFGCGDDDNGGTPTTGADGGTDGANGADTGAGDTGNGTGNPAPPAIGAQIDRFGRPAINTATLQTFTPNATREAAQDAYNADGNTGGWVAAHGATIAASLGVLDSLDTNCGNQAFADPDAGANRYGTLGSVLADDRMWLDTSQTACTQYLGVELKATGVAPALADCGGRRLAYDVVDVTYSAVAIGTVAGVTDGIDKVAEKTDGTVFPYLAAP